MKKIIKLVNPPITTYPAIANILSLKWNNKISRVWFMDHFIQLIIRPNHEHTFGDFYDHADIDNFYRIIFGLPGLGWMRVNKDVACFSSFTDYIEREIQNGYCIEACLDQYYFKLSNNYMMNHYKHSTLIFGYDSDKKKIYIADFFDDGKYVSKEVCYDEINMSMNNDWLINMYRDEEAEYEYNEDLMKLYFEDYVNSRDSLKKFIFSNKKYNNEVLFGLSYYDYLLDCLDKDIDFDYRLYHILYDHKVLMKYRLEFLNELNRYDSNKIDSLKCENISLLDGSKVLRNLYLKQSVKPSMQLKKI